MLDKVKNTTLTSKSPRIGGGLRSDQELITWCTRRPDKEVWDVDPLRPSLGKCCSARGGR